jgi:hypothetical protein
MAEQRWWHRGMGTARACGALAAVVTGALAAVAVPAGAASAATASVPTQAVSFTTTGEHAFRVPLGITSVHVVAIGGRGGEGYQGGGLGARVEADVRVGPGTTIYAEVGGNGAQAQVGGSTVAQGGGTAQVDPTRNQPAAGGANGGKPGGAWQNGVLAQRLGVLPDSGAGGGGASDLQTCPVAACQPIDAGSGALLLVAGGGGGAGAESTGGNGGTPAGGNAGPNGNFADANIDLGTGATDTAAGSNYQHIASYGPAVAHCSGDAGDSFGGGGGGGGYYCGGGGASVVEGGGGGGGSSYAPAGASYSVVTQDPLVTITYKTAFRLAPASRSSLTLDGAGGGVTQQAPSGASSQLWQLVPQGSLYQIVNLATGQCLTTWGTAGAQLFLWPCTIAQAANEWQLPANFGASASGSLIYNPAYNLVIDVYGGSITAGGAIDAWPYNGGYANQYFLTFPA